MKEVFQHRNACVGENKLSAQDSELGCTLETSRNSSLIKYNSESDPIPDGGWLAWSQAGFCHLVMFNTWGLINSFGTFQNYYHSTLLPSNDPSSISWIGSIQVFLLFFVGSFSGHLSDMGYFRSLFLSGSVLIVVGLLMTSFASSYWQLLFAQGVCIGLGNGFLFCPSLSILSTYFSSKRTIALGICAAGSATGGIIYSTLFSYLLTSIGFSWTIRVATIIEFVCLSICNLGLQPRAPPKKSRKIFDVDDLRDTSFILFTLGMLFNLWGAYFAAHYISLYANTILGLSFHESMNILVIFNGIGIIGRTVPNIIADYYVGPLNILIILCMSCGMLSFSWIAVHERAGLYVWAVFYGILSAALQSIYPAALSNLTKDISKTGTRMGLFFTFVSFTALTGSPIAGELIERQSGKYMFAQIFSGLSMMVGSGFLIAARMTEARNFFYKI